MKPVSPDSPGMRRIVAVLEAAEGALNGHQIAAAAHVSFHYFQNQARKVLAAAGRIHLAGYQHNTRGPFVPTYRPGAAPAGFRAKKPPKINQLERARNWKHRSGYNEARKAARRIRRPPDQALRALMGGA